MKRIFCILLTLALVLGLQTVVQTAVLASGTTITVPGDFATIQEAVDAAHAGDTIRVAAGEYEAFLVLEKQNIRIVSTEGATVTTASYYWEDLGSIIIADAWVMAAVSDSENIRIDGIGFDGTDITGERVVVGIAYVDSTGSLVNASVENITGTEVGAGVVIAGVGETEPGTVTTEMKGCTISGNAIGVFISEGSAVEARFNRIVGNAQFGVLNDGGQTVDATYNWWGHALGPFHSTNPTGTGNPVSDNVIFDPWTMSEVVTEIIEGDGMVDAKTEADTEVHVTVKGTTTVVTVVPYPDNPVDVDPSDFIALGKYIDVYIPDTTEVEEIEIRLYYTDHDVGDISQALRQYLQLLWWDVTQWRQCSDHGINATPINGYSGYMWVKLRDNTTPTLDYLKGGEFGGYGGPTEVKICAIATAVYGTDTAKEIDILREFRDTLLLPNSLGAKFVSFYYKTSPPIANFISQHEVLRTVVRVGFVDPIVRILSRTRYLWSERGS